MIYKQNLFFDYDVVFAFYNTATLATFWFHHQMDISMSRISFSVFKLISNITER